MASACQSIAPGLICVLFEARDPWADTPTAVFYLRLEPSGWRLWGAGLVTSYHVGHPSRWRYPLSGTVRIDDRDAPRIRLAFDWIDTPRGSRDPYPCEGEFGIDLAACAGLEEYYARSGILEPWYDGEYDSLDTN